MLPFNCCWILKSNESVRAGRKLSSRKKLMFSYGALTPGCTGDCWVGVTVGNGLTLPSVPSRQAVAGVTLLGPPHAPVIDGLTQEMGFRKPSPKTGVETLSMPRVLLKKRP